MDRIGPQYQQIAGQLRDAITRGTYHPGDALPTVRVLSKRTGCDVKTVRKAIGVLEHEGLIRTVPGKGNYVR